VKLEEYIIYANLKTSTVAAVLLTAVDHHADGTEPVFFPLQNMLLITSS